MANKVVANLGSFVSALLALLWVVTLIRPWTWLWSDNAIVQFQVTLFSIYVKKGTLGHLTWAISALGDHVFGTQAAKSVNVLFNQAFWMEEGVQQLCMPGIRDIWQWCETWVMVKYGSMIFLFLGFLTAIFLAMGGAFMYYYTHYHATHTGRMWIRACFVVAPCCAWTGLLQYVLLTFWLGKSQRIETSSNYGSGFVIACALTILSGGPLYVHGVFSKKDDFEKHGDNDVFEEQGWGAGGGPARNIQLSAMPGGVGLNYPPQAQMQPGPQMQPGYPSSQPAMYGGYRQTQVQVQYNPGSVQYSAGAAPYNAGGPAKYPMPGSGAPAW